MATETDADKSDIENPNSAPKEDKKDKDSSNKSLVTPEEDAEYMKAVENGDMKTAARMVREVAAKAFPNTKIIDEDGKPMVMYHGTEWDGNGAFYEGGLYFTTRDMALEFIEGSDDGKILSLFVNMENPYYARMGLTKEDGTPYRKADGYDTLNADDVSWGEDIQGALEKRGFDGIIDAYDDDPIDNNAIFNKIFDSGAVKSAEPVTYDNEGNVIPLSRRFDDGDDIRGDILGEQKDQYKELMAQKHSALNAEEVLKRISQLGSREEMAAEFKRIMEGENTK